MANLAESLNIDQKILSERLEFLTKRAKRHMELHDESVSISKFSALHLGCAATLHRDAGAIAIILGLAEQSRLAFAAAGAIRLRLGFYDGLYSLSIGNSDVEEYAKTLRQNLSWIDHSLRGDELEKALPRFVAAANRSPRQLISILQVTGASDMPLEELSGLATQRLIIYAGFFLGVTQTPVGRYLALLSELRRGELNNGVRTLISMLIKREEIVSAAQLDTYHWRLAQKPADLIDMDMLALGLVALEQDEKLFEKLRSIASEYDPSVKVPFDAALLIKAVPPRRTPPRAVRL